jgi:hypothetical protein
MTTTINLRFQKKDVYENSIFIAAASNPDEVKQYKTLDKFAKQLMSLDTKQFLPIFSNDEFQYATIRCKKNSKFPNLVENSIYKITFDTKKKSKDNKVFINCYLRKLKLVKKADVVDLGDDIVFE